MRALRAQLCAPQAISALCLLSLARRASSQSSDLSKLHHAHHLIGLALTEAYKLPEPEAQQVKAPAEPPANQSASFNGSDRGIPTVVASLARNKDRQKVMQQRLQAVGAQFQFVDAIDAQQQLVPGQMLGSWPGLRDFGANATGQQRHQQPLAYNFSLPWKCHLTTVPQMSCTLSHLFTIFSAHQAGLEEVLVMEDDMEILRWPSRAVLGDPPPGWGALQLYMLGNSANQLYRSPPGRWVPWAPGLFNTGAYIINRTGMQRVLDTYLPGALAQGSLMAAELNLSSVFESHCVADWVVYNAAGTFASTDFFFVESGQTSDIAPEQLGPHHDTKALVEELLAHGGFRHNYTR